MLVTGSLIRPAFCMVGSRHGCLLIVGGLLTLELHSTNRSVPLQVLHLSNAITLTTCRTPTYRINYDHKQEESMIRRASLVVNAAKQEPG